MSPEAEVRMRLAKMYGLICSDMATPERLEKAAAKLSEAIDILSGTEVPATQGEESRG